MGPLLGSGATGVGSRSRRAVARPLLPWTQAASTFFASPSPKRLDHAAALWVLLSGPPTRGTSCRRRSRPRRSNVRIADVFAAAAQPEAGRERASRRSPAIECGSTSPLLASTGGVISSIAFLRRPTRRSVRLGDSRRDRPLVGERQRSCKLRQATIPRAIRARSAA
jgi:hypothetical protein